MSKRKRADIESIIDQIEDRAIRIKASRLQARFEHGVASLKNALTLARGFERQKLGRRQKQASHEPHLLLRLREEVIVLKELDIAKTASDYLLKQLVRTKRIRESTAFSELFGRGLKIEPPKGNAEANVLGRLFKASPVKDVLPEIMGSFRQILGLENANVINDTDKNSEPVSKRVSSRVDTEEHFKLTNQPPPPQDMNLDRVNTSHEPQEEPTEISMMKSDNEHQKHLDPMEVFNVESSDYESHTPSISSSNNHPQHESSAPVKHYKSMSDKVTSTAFLPSLSIGGYYSGSDSEDEEIDSRLQGPPLPKQRNNRRGQRERQKLAELKYGKNAKHLQKLQNMNPGTNTVWDAKRGAIDHIRSGKQRRHGEGRSMGSKGRSCPNGEALRLSVERSNAKTTAKKKNEPLHPSWEAARKKKQESGNTAFAGKKITFE